MSACAAVWRSLQMRSTRLQVFVRARQKLGEILSAFEFFDQQALDLTLKHLEGVRNPLPDTQTPFYLVVETSGSNEEHDNEKLQVRLIIFLHVINCNSIRLPCREQSLGHDHTITNHTAASKPHSDSVR